MVTRGQPRCIVDPQAPGNTFPAFDMVRIDRSQLVGKEVRIPSCCSCFVLMRRSSVCRSGLSSVCTSVERARCDPSIVSARRFLPNIWPLPDAPSHGDPASNWIDKRTERLHTFCHLVLWPRVLMSVVSLLARLIVPFDDESLKLEPYTHRLA